MILPLPVQFDENEWFIIISLLFFALVLVVLPKRFPWIVTVLLFLFNCMLSKTVDYFIAAAFPLDLYDYNDTAKLDLFDEALQFLLYPLAGYMINYWYDSWRPKGFRLVWYVLIAAFVSTTYEWFSVEAHVYLYKGWHLYYSMVAYVILVAINIVLFERLKKWQNA